MWAPCCWGSTSTQMWLQGCCFSNRSGWRDLALAISSHTTPSFSQRVWKTYRPGGMKRSQKSFRAVACALRLSLTMFSFFFLFFLQRVNYLKSKKFSSETVASMVSKAPYLLNFSVKRLDNRLGFFQFQLNLSASNVSIFHWCRKGIAVFES